MTPRLPALLLALLALTASLPAALAQADEPEPQEPAEAEGARQDEEDEDEVEDADRPEDEKDEDEDEEKDADEERDDDEDDREDDEWEEETRDLSFRTDEDGFEYDSRRRTALAHDEIRARYDTEDATFRFDYESERPNETELSFRVHFVALGEHEDTNGNGAYDVGELVHQRFEIQRLSRPTLTSEQHPTHATATVTYALPGGGIFALRFHVASHQTTVGGVSLAPTETKYDVIVTDFPWNSTTSRLFLETRARTHMEAEVDEDDAKPGLEFANGTIQGYYRWLNTTSADGRDEPVGASVLASRTTQDGDEATHENIVVFSYAHGASIVHDPSLGVAKVVQAVQEIVDRVKGDWRVWSAAAAVATVIILATALPRLRRP